MAHNTTFRLKATAAGLALASILVLRTNIAKAFTIAASFIRFALLCVRNCFGIHRLLALFYVLFCFILSGIVSAVSYLLLQLPHSIREEVINCYYINNKNRNGRILTTKRTDSTDVKCNEVVNKLPPCQTIFKIGRVLTRRSVLL